ncbi:hypothetical protein Ciccas_011704 [Cichlidogyrus casuarinus]|uniref:Uncharacterized protein n=1 Tax=Cichlidogyrus casuarinus TaxID=1844966 RepID=A0ABD2PTG5_9PLAT
MAERRLGASTSNLNQIGLVNDTASVAGGTPGLTRFRPRTRAGSIAREGSMLSLVSGLGGPTGEFNYPTYTPNVNRRSRMTTSFSLCKEPNSYMDTSMMKHSSLDVCMNNQEFDTTSFQLE